jgi:hypothetical protein
METDYALVFLIEFLPDRCQLLAFKLVTSTERHRSAARISAPNISLRMGFSPKRRSRWE